MTVPDLDTRIAEIAEWFARFDEGWIPAQVGRDDIAWLCEDAGPFLLAALQQTREALREIADLPRPLGPNLSPAAAQCDFLKGIARAALAPEQTKDTHPGDPARDEAHRRYEEDPFDEQEAS